MSQLLGNWGDLGWIALKALLLYVTAVAGFRIGKRRTLAEMSPFDFVAAVAVGAIVGRVPNATGTSYAAGAATLVAVLAAHAVITRLRFFPSVARLVDHPPCLLVAHGQVVEKQLRHVGLTRGDLDALLREHGVADLTGIRYVIFEQRGRISVIRNEQPTVRVPFGDTGPSG